MSALLSMRGIRKSFPGVQALRGIDLELFAGEVLALVGENGAGKSTLIRILAGALQPDAGEIFWQGAPLRLSNPLEAQRAGIAVIYQELNLAPALSARENIFLGHPCARYGWIASSAEKQMARSLFNRLGLDLDPEIRCRDLSVAQQQAVEIARALSLQARLLVMDEPTAALSTQEVERLFAIIRDLKAQGIGIVYISHRLDEIYTLADRLMVLRDGQQVATRPAGEVRRDELIELMVGRRLDQEFPRREAAIGEVRLQVCNLSRGRRVRNVSLSIRRGEVVGLTGLVGSGRTETARLLAGADRADSGFVELDGRRLVLRDPRDAMAAGIALLTEDRKMQGLVLGQTVRENFGLLNLARFSRWGWLRTRAESNALAQYVDQLRIRISSQNQPVKTLSGGNQQKVVLAKWLEHRCEVVLFDEPTRGIDVGAKYEVFLLINALAAQGKCVLLISSELPEVLGMSDRILVMRAGQLAGEITEASSATQEHVMHLAIGGH